MIVINSHIMYRWEVRLIEKCWNNAIQFLIDIYDVKEKLFDNVCVKVTRTSFNSRYFHRKKEYTITDEDNKSFNMLCNLIVLSIKDKNIFLYNRKSIGEYRGEYINIGYEKAWTCRLIHELIHHIQNNENRKYSEVETTKVELQYLKSVGICTQY